MTQFSICIPNYNYEKYLGRTLASVHAQDFNAWEICVADNASTDGSVDIVNGFASERLRLRRNGCNVGFSRNLDCAARMAVGDRLLMLSSDDLMAPAALSTYARVLAAIPAASRCVLTSGAQKIDGDDRVLGYIGPDPELFRPSDRDASLSSLVGGAVYRVAASSLLNRAMLRMKNPFNFLATSFARARYEELEGYGGGRLFSPDKWFHWRLLGVVDEAIFIDRPLFSYRWHGSNQTAQQAATGALKYLADSYANTLEADTNLLKRAGIERDALVDAYSEYDVGRHGLACLARGEEQKARRILAFGLATYPQRVMRQPSVIALGGLLSLGPAGRALAKAGYARYRSAATPSAERWSPG